MTIPVNIARCNATSLVKNVLTELYDSSFSPLTPTAGNIPIGSGVVWASTPVSGDITINSAGVVAIGVTKVTNAMLAGSIADTKLLTISTAGKVSNSATTATSANTASAIIARDGSGNFSAGTITAALSGNATTASAAPAGTLTGTTLNSTVVTSSLTSVGAQAQALNMGSHLINNVTDPSSAQDAATKNYVDNALAAQDSKPSVVYASTSALPSNTYNNGTLGVGATLTATSNGPLLIDGVTILLAQAGERVLVAAEATSANNGWYTITQVGVIAVSPYILTRATESDQASEIGAGYLTSVTAPNSVTPGTSNNGKVFISIANDPFTVGTTSLTFSQVGGTYSAGTGLTLSGSTFSITNTAVTAASYGSATQSPTYTTNAQGQLTAASNVTITPAVGSITGLGTGIAAALAVNAGSAGAPVLFNGAGGTPTSIVLTNATGTASGLTAGNVTTNANLTGDVTSVGNATTIGASKVTNAMLAGSIADTKLSTIATAGKVSNSATTATSANTTSAIVARDASGNFTASDISATSLIASTIYGGAGDSSILNLRSTSSATPSNDLIRMYTNNTLRFILNNNGEATFSYRVLSPEYMVSGLSTGEISILGQANAGTYNFNLPISAGTTSQVLTSQGGGSTAMNWTTVASANTASTIVIRDGSGNFAAGTITAALTGNASTATALQNARTIGGVSFDGTANITVASATGGFTISGGALAVGANDITCTGSLGATGARLTKGWFADLQVTNAIAGSITGNAATATTLATARAIYGNNFDGSAALAQIIASTYGGTGNGFTKFSGATTAEKTYTLPDASTTILTTNAAVTVGQGGTGQTSYTNGQLLIGNTTGNTLAKATLTGTSNQITITNGASSITLSTPQDIAAASSPTFAGLTLNNNGSALSGTTPLISMPNTLSDGNYINVGTGGRNVGVFNGGNLFLTANLDYNATTNVYAYNSTAAATAVELGQTGGALRYAVSGTGGNTATVLDALTWSSTNGNVSIPKGDLLVSRSNSGGLVRVESINSSNTSGSNADILVSVAGTSGGDATITFDISGTGGSIYGVDNSDFDATVLSIGSSLGTNNVWRMSTAGERTLPLQPSFLAYNSATDTDVTGDGTLYTVICDTEVFDRSSDYNNATGVFTAPVTGLYSFHALSLLQGVGAANTNGGAVLVTSNRSYYAYDNVGARRNGGNESLVTIAQPWADMDAGDTASFAVSANNGTKVVDVYGTGGTAMQTFFSGGLVA